MADPPHPPLTVSLTVKYPLFFDNSLKDDEHSGNSRDDNGHDEDKDEDDDPDEHPGGSQADPRLWSATR